MVSAADAKRVVIYQAEDASFASTSLEIVQKSTFDGKKGVGFKAGVKPNDTADLNAPDIVFHVNEPKPGRFYFRTATAVNDAGAEKMRKATSKYASLFAQIQINDRRPTRRVVFVPWSAPEFCVQTLGIFDLTNGIQMIKFWLPEGVLLDRLEIRPYRPPAVDKGCVAYKPPYLPPPYHPRLWVNSNSLATAQSNLTHPEHVKQWEIIKKSAHKPFSFKFEPNSEVKHSAPLEKAAAAKAFVYLMTTDIKRGREAVQLMLEYLPRVEFGNLLDITREEGAAIYAAACVYDWCYNLCTSAERATLRHHMLRLAEELECGWPPFRGSVVNGHGNEAMHNRDLLSMAIAVFDEDPVPYQYCAYRLLEQLVPLRKFEYQSPRHNQGVGYSTYRFAWEMHAAWLFRRMLDQEVFDPNIKNVPLYWLYMRLPNGEMLRDGDGIARGKYWPYPTTSFLCSAYSGDPIVKGEFMRQGGASSVDPVLYLLLNNPEIKAEPSLDALPLTMGFGPILSGMIARTGWEVGTNSNDVVVEIKGGGYHFGNHQHADAGALQVYYRGLQIADLGQYRFYGTPYDVNFNKRSIAHSMMLVIDPAEKFLSTPANDGGARYVQRHPKTPAELQQNLMFHYGTNLSYSVAPVNLAPDFSYYSVNLTSAYTKKISSFVRTFCFMNLGCPATPAAMLVFDDITTVDPSFKKHLQFNTLCPPVPTPDGMSFHNSAFGVTGRLDVCMLWPKPGERTVEVKSGDEAHNVFGFQCEPPSPKLPESNGHRVLFTPTKARRHDRFLTLLRVCDATTAPPPYELSATPVSSVLRISDRIVSLAKGVDLISELFEITIPADGQSYKVLLAGMSSGRWTIAPTSGEAAIQTVSEAGKNTLFFTSKGGVYQIAPTPLR